MRAGCSPLKKDFYNNFGKWIFPENEIVYKGNW